MRKQAFIRIIVALVGTVNAILTAKGLNPIPFDETLVTEWLSYAFDGAMVFLVWWKNSPVTKHAQEAQKYLETLKANGEAE
jgi:SPP1 family holin